MVYGLWFMVWVEGFTYMYRDTWSINVAILPVVKYSARIRSITPTTLDYMGTSNLMTRVDLHRFCRLRNSTALASKLTYRSKLSYIYRAQASLPAESLSSSSSSSSPSPHSCSQGHESGRDKSHAREIGQQAVYRSTWLR